jgi:hypothetical protein
MGYRVNGIGMWPCKAGYNAGWGPDDAVECFTFLWLPLLPGNAIHILTEKEASSQVEIQVMPIRSSNELVGQVLLRGWSQTLLIAGLVFFVPCVILELLPRPANADPSKTFSLLPLLVVVGAACVLGLAGCMWARRRTTRTRKLRLLLGRHRLGNSDPATWMEETRKQAVTSPREMFGVDTFAQAVEPLLSRGDLRRALWAARLSTACEDPARGEALTDAVLNHAGVPDALEQIRLQMRCRN